MFNLISKIIVPSFDGGSSVDVRAPAQQWKCAHLVASTTSMAMTALTSPRFGDSRQKFTGLRLDLKIMILEIRRVWSEAVLDCHRLQGAL
ncbi:unnamed protein product [Closterium sp. Naga37s-1]|nr:unnamed protein product [Closterium sp. Naga37s-1]